MAIDNEGTDSPPRGARNPNQDMQHYLSHGGKESTLYEEGHSSASKPASQPYVAG